MITMQEDFLLVEEVAKVLRLSEDTVTRLLRQGRIPGYKIEGTWRIDRSDLQTYLAGKKNTQKK